MDVSQLLKAAYKCTLGGRLKITSILLLFPFYITVVLALDKV